MNWNALDARARSCSYPLLDLIIPIQDWPRCDCDPGSTTLQRRRTGEDRAWWWCLVCNLPVRRAGLE